MALSSVQLRSHSRYEPVGLLTLNIFTFVLGTLQELAVASCQSLSSATHPSGIYWVNLNGKSQAKPFKVYCEMETDGGGWALVWSYTFTNYGNFGPPSNAVVPRPTWPAVGPHVNVLVSTTPPLNETDFNAMDFLLWKQFGNEILIKSNINNRITWIKEVWETGKQETSVARSPSALVIIAYRYRRLVIFVLQTS